MRGGSEARLITLPETHTQLPASICAETAEASPRIPEDEIRFERVSHMSMRFYSVALCLILAGATPALAVEGYAFVAPGGLSGAGFTNGTLHVGGGVEHVVTRGIGIGAELGAVGSWRNYHTAIGIFSLNGSYHFNARGSKFDPFVTGGYSLGFRNGTLNFGNFGGGLNYWFGDHLGFRAEVRNHMHVSDRVPNLHYWGVRFGLSFP
jgi:hypothetical protein